jgi:hypothetical protein
VKSGRPAHPDVQSRAWKIVAVALLTVGGAIGASLALQWFDVYFAIWDAPVVSEGDQTRYLWTAGTAVALLLAAIGIAIMRRARRVGIIGGVLLMATVLLAILFAVPEGRWTPAPASPVPDNSEYLPCFGEGDPNCPGG